MKNKGFTLIEMVIYMALFSIIMGGLIVTVFQLVQSSEKLTSKDIVQGEINFVLKKLDWTLIGASSISVSADKKTLTVTNNSNSYVFKLENKKIKLNGADLTTSNVEVTNLVFNKINTDPSGVSVDLKIKELNSSNEASTTYTKYLRI
jgi:prepilin-type N-terminal cleavage/methylation domain-containing protein